MRRWFVSTKHEKDTKIRTSIDDNCHTSGISIQRNRGSDSNYIVCKILRNRKNNHLIIVFVKFTHYLSRIESFKA